ncbi:hypothetical protein C8Q80DRAFT_497591 [Daedaleopsis nitida]|nr:hypothetical protein C8Q80DRAFT_497591 [Daedaleopsis nitida]
MEGGYPPTHGHTQNREDSESVDQTSEEYGGPSHETDDMHQRVATQLNTGRIWTVKNGHSEGSSIREPACRPRTPGGHGTCGAFASLTRLTSYRGVEQATRASQDVCMPIRESLTDGDRWLAADGECGSSTVRASIEQSIMRRRASIWTFIRPTCERVNREGGEQARTFPAGRRNRKERVSLSECSHIRAQSRVQGPSPAAGVVG